ncbi:kinesin-like protein KIF26A isoform X2 [Protopterus annectens]|uniref:kinesin-like protein KIF26A isoform X2 n=1 Tax=Protopterus annectens TaxID=7888 RepID=UPI001CFA78C1|nr:kinesin-like protein KIF26A isoform X2 [Protopterus annectens]
MALEKTPDNSGATRKNPASFLDLGALCLDSDIIFGFTSHLLKRRAKATEGCVVGEVPQIAELAPRRRLQSGVEGQSHCGRRPAPEGAGAASITEPSHFERTHKGTWCQHCQIRLAELKKQALKLAIPGALKDPGYSALIFNKLQVPDYSQKGHNEGESRCEVCATHLNQLKQEVIHMVQMPHPTSVQAVPDCIQSSVTVAKAAPRLTAQNMLTLSSPRDWSVVSGQVGQQPEKSTNLLPGTDRRKGLEWPQGMGNFPKSSVQVTVAPSGLSSTLSSVTIQAQQYLEGIWSISRVNSFLPQACLTQTTTAEGVREGACNDVPPVQNNCGEPRMNSTLVSQSGHASVASGPSAAASFFIRAAQKLNLSSKRRKHHTPLPHCESSIYATNFSGILQVSPPPVPPCLLRAMSKVKDNPGIGKVKVMTRICSSQGNQDTSESMSFLKVDPRKKQITLYDPSVNGHSNSGHKRTVAAAVPKIFAFDAVFSQDASQAEVCSGTVAEVIQSVVNGADGCIFCFGHVKLGKTYTMIGNDSSTQSLGIIPCAISWLFKLINERKEKTGTRFSVRVSAVEIHGKDENLKDLLSEVASGSLQDAQSPGIYLREDPICGTQLQNQSELRAPTAEKAAFFLDAAIAARSTSRPDCDEDERRNSHMLFTLHIYQYRMEKSGKGGMSGGRSRLHLIDLGSCEKVLSKSRDGGGGLCLSLTALGNVVLALVNGAKHVPYKDSKLTMLLRESLGNINCRTTMIAHISDSPGNYAETLTTIQLASRILRMRKKKSKYASSSSGGESSCEEGRMRRPPHLRPFHPRTIALDPDLPALSISSDPDYSSSSEQSCDTVIYVGPNGAALSDRELTDNEGPPEFVPIIPSLNRKRSKDRSASVSSSDNDHLKCNTFAELQERLECIDGSEEPAIFVCEEGTTFTSNCSQVQGRLDNVQSKSLKETSSSPGTYAKSVSQETVSPKRGQNLCSQASLLQGTRPQTSNTPQSITEHSKLKTKADTIKVNVGVDDERETINDSWNALKAGVSKPLGKTEVVSEPVVREKSFLSKRPLPSPAPPPPQHKEHFVESQNVFSELDTDNKIRTPPVGMSSHMSGRHEQRPLGCISSGCRSSQSQPGAVGVSNFRSIVRDKCFDRDILTTTVTLQQPVELNGEDELVFTVVEELSFGGILDSGRPASLISFNSDCSLQALASGSRPVSIISSINDEFDAYTSQTAASGVNIDIVVPLPDDLFANGSRRSSISSWLSEVSICTIESDGAQSCDSFVAQSCYTCEGAGKIFHLQSPNVLHETSATVTPCAKNSLSDSGFCFSEMDSESADSRKLTFSISRSLQTSDSTKVTASYASKKTALAKAATIQPSQGALVSEVVHSSLPRKTKPTSSATHNSSTLNCKELQRQDVTFGDPWLLRCDSQIDVNTSDQMPCFISSSQLKETIKSVQNFSSVPRPVKSQTMLACSQRVVDGCEMVCKASSEVSEKTSSKMPQLKRGATTLGTVSTDSTPRGNSEVQSGTGSLKSSTGKKASVMKTSLPRPNGTAPPAPPVRKSSLDHKNRVLLQNAASKASMPESSKVSSSSKSEDDTDGKLKNVTCFNECSASNNSKPLNSKADHSAIKTNSSLKTRVSRAEAVHRYGSQTSLERCESLTSVGSKSSLTKENNAAVNNGRAGRSVPKLGMPSASSAVISLPSCPMSAGSKANQPKCAPNQKPVQNGSKNRGLSASSPKSLSSSVKSLAQPVNKTSGIPPNGKTAPRCVQGVNGKPGRGTIMGTKQAIRAANSRVNELATGNSPCKAMHLRGSADSDSGNDSGVNLSDEKSQLPMLPSPYSKITAPRRPQRYSSGHGSDNSSVLSGELPPAMGRTALFYHSGGSSGYESMIRDSEATGSASSAHDSMSETGMSTSGRARTSRSPKKRSAGLQRRRLIPAPLPDTSSLGRKQSITGQWVDLPPLPGTMKEPFEIKVYEIDDVERLQRHRPEETEPFQDVEKGLMYFNTKLKILERRQQQIKDLMVKHEMLKEELEQTKERLMMDPSKWRGEFEVDPDLDKESQEYLEALEQVTEDLEQCVNLCKSHIMMVTCFDIGVIADVHDGAREVEV